MKLITRREQRLILDALTTIQIFAAANRELIGDENVDNISYAVWSAAANVAGDKGHRYILNVYDRWRKKHGE